MSTRIRLRSLCAGLTALTLGHLCADQGTISPLPLPAAGPERAGFVAGADVPQDVILDDIDGDGAPELLVPQAARDHVAIFEFDASPGLTPVRVVPVDTDGTPESDLPRDIELVDLDGDCVRDLIVVNSGIPGVVPPSLALCRGMPGGRFAAPDFVPLGEGVAFSQVVAVGQIDGEGGLDIAVGHRETNNVTVLFGLPGGMVFAPPEVVEAPSFGFGTTDLMIANLANDFHAELIVANEPEILILTNGPGGPLSQPRTLVTGISIQDMELTDVDGDGRLDLVFVDGAHSRITTLFAITPLGTYAARVDSPTPGHLAPIALVVDDFDLDAELDVAVAYNVSNSLAIWRGDGSGNFTAAIDSVSTGLRPRALAAGHLTAEGTPDLITANEGDEFVADNPDHTVLLRDSPPPDGVPRLRLAAATNLAVQAGAAVCQAQGLGVDPETGDRWLCDPARNRLVRVNGLGEPQAAIPLAPLGAFDPQDVAVDPGTGDLWVAGEHGDALYRIAADGALLEDQASLRPTGIAVHPGRGQVLVTSRGIPGIFALQPDGVPLALFALPEELEVCDLAVDPGTGHVWGAVRGSGAVVEIALEDGPDQAVVVGVLELEGLANILGGAAVRGVGFDSQRGHVVITTSTGLLITVEPVGDGAELVSIRPHDIGVNLGGVCALDPPGLLVADSGVLGNLLQVGPGLELSEALALNRADQHPERRWRDTATADEEIHCLYPRGNAVVTFNPMGQFQRLQEFGDLRRRASALVYHPGVDRLFVLAEGRLVRIRRDGGEMHMFPVDATFAEASMSIDPVTGHIVLLSARHRRLMRLSPNGDVLARHTVSHWLPRFLAPRGLAIRPNGNWVLTTDQPGVVLELTEGEPAAGVAHGILLR